MNSLGRELDSVAIGFTPAAELNFIAAKSANFEKAVAFDSCQLRSIGDSYFCDLAWLEFTLEVIDLDRVVFTVVIDALDGVLCWHQR